jgi:ATP-dependent Clp protease adaptor protein ClpS
MSRIAPTMVAPQGTGARLETGSSTTVAPETRDDLNVDRPWLVIVWNDPVNLMSYVTYVFQKLFGYSLPKATRLMLDVHHKGRAVVASGPRERAELDVSRLHSHGLWATLEHQS